MTTTTSVESIQPGKRRHLEIITIAVCAFANIVDGADLMAMSFTAPTIAQQWDLAATEVGFLFSAGLIGLLFGALTLSPLGDSIGRRPTLILCMTITMIGTLTSAMAGNVMELSMARFLTGLGVGGAGNIIGVLVSEYAPPNRQTLAVGLVTVGLPAGSMLGGLVASALLERHGWQSVFLVNGMLTGISLLSIVWLIPESLEYLLHRRPKAALKRINAVRRRIGEAPLAELPVTAEVSKVRITDLFGRDLYQRTLLICGTYFAYMTSYYYILNWMPKLMTDLGFAVSESVTTAVWLAVGGMFGAICTGLIATRTGPKAIALILMTMLSVLIAIFGVAAGSVPLLAIDILAAIMGFVMFGVATAVYTCMIRLLPPGVRATGSGAGLAAGRLGAAFGTYAGGLLLGSGFSIGIVCLIMAVPGLLGVVLVYKMPRA